MHGTAINKRLNLESIETNLETLGLTQTNVADTLGVSRQTVSQWLKGVKFPRPVKLLKLSKLLQLPFDDLIIKTDTSLEPIVAFRKKGNHKISDAYLEDAKDKGYLLQQLVEYLPFDSLSRPPSLISPQLDYDYIQQAANRVRQDINKTVRDEIRFEDLINFFIDHHAVIIPVFWGNVDHHQNALHVYLPASMTTWIYINLDSKIHDFKFWMAHELGHVKTPELKQDASEDFADQFAAALLVSQDFAEEEYNTLSRMRNKGQQINRLKEVAEELVVSPLTVYYEVNRLAEHLQRPRIDLESGQEIFRATTVFQKSYKSVAEYLFENLPPSPRKYITIAEEAFNTPFFAALKKLPSSRKSVSFLQELLNLSPADTHSLHEEIS